jgi:hypothetical protein
MAVHKHSRLKASMHRMACWRYRTLLSNNARTPRLKWRRAACRFTVLSLSTYSNKYHRAILDARLSFKRVKGFAIYFVFATKEELESWPKKRFPGGDDLKGKAAKMESTRIGLNFAFEGGSK